MQELLIDRRSEIKNVAQNLFREKGYAGTTVRDIARGMKMEAASLYNHIKSKEEILHEICFGMADEFFAGLNTISKNLPAQKKIELAITNHIHVVLKNPDASNAFFHEWIYMKEDNLRKFKVLRSNYEKKFRNILEEGMEKKVFSGRDIKLTIFTLFSAMNALHELQHHLKSKEEEEIIESFTEILLKGILK